MFTAPIGLLNPNVGGSYPSVIEDGNTVGWYISDDLTTITKDGSDLVSVWADKLGSGHDLLQALANKPLWSINGILFDGINDYLKTAPFTFNQPEFIYIVFNQITWTTSRRIFDGNVSSSGMLYNRIVTPELTAYSGVLSSVNNNLAVNTFGIIRVLFNGAASKFVINETTPITGDFGTNNMGGFTLGARGDISNFSNIQVKEILLRKIADSTGDEQDIYDYLASKYSI